MVWLSARPISSLLCVASCVTTKRFCPFCQSFSSLLSMPVISGPFVLFSALPFFSATCTLIFRARSMTSRRQKTPRELPVLKTSALRLLRPGFQISFLTRTQLRPLMKSLRTSLRVRSAKLTSSPPFTPLTLPTSERRQHDERTDWLVLQRPDAMRVRKERKEKQGARETSGMYVALWVDNFLCRIRNVFSRVTLIFEYWLYFKCRIFVSSLLSRFLNY